MPITTIDLDFNNKDKIADITSKIIKCKYLIILQSRESASLNGIHLWLYCSRQCEICRTVFDDSFRFFADYTNRKPHQRNVVWSLKHYRKGKTTLKLYAPPFKVIYVRKIEVK